MMSSWAQSALNPAGPQSGHILTLWWVFLGICLVIYGIVCAVLLLSILNSTRRAAGSPADYRRRGRVVGGALAITAAILLGFMVSSVMTGRQISDSNGFGSRTISVTGHQWWWEIRYDDPDPSKIFSTANELHIPVGQKILIRGKSSDVIHSLWVPNLHGKRDLIPGRTTTVWIEADRPGTWRGQCAEFCGLQHAHMALMVVAESPADFEKWLERQRQPAIVPSTEEQRRGQAVLENQSCVLCHTIRGTKALGQVAPDLTHIGSRLTIAAGSLPNNRGNLGGWITDSHRVKPGNRMPPIPVNADDLNPLVSYLESLQ